MTLLVDTSLVVDHLCGNEGARDFLVQALADGERIAASVVTKAEILAGVRPGEEERTHALLERIEWLEVDEEIAERAGELAAQYGADGSGVSVADCLIAATAERLAATDRGEPGADGEGASLADTLILFAGMARRLQHVKIA